MFMVTMPKLGASMIPLDEFPITASKWFKVDKYLNCPKHVYADALSLLFETNESIKSLIILP